VFDTRNELFIEVDELSLDGLYWGHHWREREEEQQGERGERRREEEGKERRI